jgi:hypothetical protein
MRRSGQRFVKALLTCLALFVWLASWPASAFHSGSDFDKPASAGGAGGVFYSGSAREKGWNCTACHVDAPANIRVEFLSNPTTLLVEKRYAPNQSYKLSLTLIGEHAGLGSPQSNYNGAVLAALDGAGAMAGKFSGYAPEELYDGGFALVSAGKKVGVTEWSVIWTAPPALTGPVTFSLCVVDGNGADSPPGRTLNDPFNDDVVCGTVLVKDSSSALLTDEPFAPPKATKRMTSHAQALAPTPGRLRCAARRLQGDHRRSLHRLKRRRRSWPPYGWSGRRRSFFRGASNTGDQSPRRR